MHWKIHPPRPSRFPLGGDFAPLGPQDWTDQLNWELGNTWCPWFQCFNNFRIIISSRGKSWTTMQAAILTGDTTYSWQMWSAPYLSQVESAKFKTHPNPQLALLRIEESRKTIIPQFLLQFHDLVRCLQFAQPPISLRGNMWIPSIIANSQKSCEISVDLVRP